MLVCDLVGSAYRYLLIVGHKRDELPGSCDKLGHNVAQPDIHGIDNIERSIIQRASQVINLERIDMDVFNLMRNSVKLVPLSMEHSRLKPLGQSARFRRPQGQQVPLADYS